MRERVLAVGWVVGGAKSEVQNSLMRDYARERRRRHLTPVRGSPRRPACPWFVKIDRKRERMAGKRLRMRLRRRSDFYPGAFEELQVGSMGTLQGGFPFPCPQKDEKDLKDLKAFQRSWQSRRTRKEFFIVRLYYCEIVPMWDCSIVGFLNFTMPQYYNLTISQWHNATITQ